MHLAPRPFKIGLDIALKNGLLSLENGQFLLPKVDPCQSGPSGSSDSIVCGCIRDTYILQRKCVKYLSTVLLIETMVMVRKLFVCDQRPWHRQFVDLPIKWKSEDLFSLLHMNQYLVEQGNFAFYIWLRKITKLFVKKEKQSQLSNYHHGIRHDGSHLTQLAEGGTF